MADVGQPLPSQDFCGTAALPLKPDIARRGWHGRKVPIAERNAAHQQTTFTGSNGSFDHLIGGKEQAGWHGQAKRLRRFEVDDRFELGRRLHRKVGGLVSAQDAVDIGRRLPIMSTKSTP